MKTTYVAGTSLKNHVSSLVWLNRAELFWQSSFWKPLHVFPGAARDTWLCFHIYWYWDIKGNYTHWLLHGPNGNKACASSQHQQCFLQFKSQNPAVWQQTAQKSNSSVLTSWKIPSLPAGKNQPLPDHLIAFEIINWILYYSSPVFFHCGF